MPAIDDIIAQVPVEGEHGWYLSSYWRYVDGTLGVDAFTDGDHEGIEENDMPTLEQVMRDWRAYYEDVARTGSDPLGQFAVSVSRTQRERWQFRFAARAVVGIVLVTARRAGRTYAPNDLPAHVREYLMLRIDAYGRAFVGDFATWAEFATAVLDGHGRPVRPHVWWTDTLDAPRSDAAVRRDLRRLARCHAARPHYTVTWDEDGTSASVRTLQVLPEDAALARRLGLDPTRVTYAPDGEAWYDGMPLTYCGDTEEATA
jgi:hypothetical protein